MLAMKRQKSTPAAVVWKAMTAVAAEYQSRAVTKIDRRPKRSATGPKAMQPRNMPMKEQKMKKPMPPIPNRPRVLPLKTPPALRPGAI